MVIEFDRDEDPEMKRILARRARDQERAKKLHNPRLRNVGADIIGIKKQMEEKKVAKKLEKAQEQAQVNQQEEIRTYLAHVQQEEAQKKWNDQVKLQQEWQAQQAVQTKEANLAVSVASEPPLVAENCGLGAAQAFDGEDPLKEERKRLQALQMREWTQTQILEKKAREAAEVEADKQYAATIQHVVSYQDAESREFSTRRAQLDSIATAENAALIKAKEDRKNAEIEQQKAAEAAEVSFARNSALLSEDPNQATSSTAPNTRIRPDHFKGMQKSQIQEIFNTNESLKAAKVAAKINEKQADVNYASQQEYYKRLLEEQEYEAAMSKAAANANTAATLAVQTEQAKEREARQKELSRGAIESGFFDGFGRSYR